MPQSRRGPATNSLDHAVSLCRGGQQERGIYFNKPWLEITVNQNVVSVHFKAVLVVDDHVLHGLNWCRWPPPRSLAGTSTWCRINSNHFAMLRETVSEVQVIRSQPRKVLESWRDTHSAQNGQVSSSLFEKSKFGAWEVATGLTH